MAAAWAWANGRASLDFAFFCARNLALLPPWRSYAAGSLYSPEIAYLVNCSRYGSAAAGGRTEVRRQPEPPKGKHLHDPGPMNL